MSAYERSVVKFSLSNFHVTQLELATTKYAIYHRSFAATRPASPLPAFPLPIYHTLSWTRTQFIIKFKYLHHFHTLMTRNLWMNTRISRDLCAVSANTHSLALFLSLACNFLCCFLAIVVASAAIAAIAATCCLYASRSRRLKLITSSVELLILSASSRHGSLGVRSGLWIFICMISCRAVLK